MCLWHSEPAAWAQGVLDPLVCTDLISTMRVSVHIGTLLCEVVNINTRPYASKLGPHLTEIQPTAPSVTSDIAASFTREALSDAVYNRLHHSAHFKK